MSIRVVVEHTLQWYHQRSPSSETCCPASIDCVPNQEELTVALLRARVLVIEIRCTYTQLTRSVARGPRASQCRLYPKTSNQVNLVLCVKFDILPPINKHRKSPYEANSNSNNRNYVGCSCKVF